MSKQLLDFPTVREAHGISREQIVEASRVRPLHEYLFEQGRPIASTMQGRIVQALSQLCGHHYQVLDFRQGVTTLQSEGSMGEKRSEGWTRVR